MHKYLDIGGLGNVFVDGGLDVGYDKHARDGNHDPVLDIG